LSLLKPEDQAKVLVALQTKAKIDPVSLEQLLNTDDGKRILSGAAEATLRPGPEGVQAIRSALMTSASSPEGLGIIGFLKAYPGTTITVDVLQAQKFLELNQQLIEANKARLQQLVKPSAPAPASPQPPVTTPR
jgi:hypothetical protein